MPMQVSSPLDHFREYIVQSFFEPFHKETSNRVFFLVFYQNAARLSPEKAP
jgi:hypothetical protein